MRLASADRPYRSPGASLPIAPSFLYASLPRAPHPIATWFMDAWLRLPRVPVRRPWWQTHTWSKPGRLRPPQRTISSRQPAAQMTHEGNRAERLRSRPVPLPVLLGRRRTLRLPWRTCARLAQGPALAGTPGRVGPGLASLRAVLTWEHAIAIEGLSESANDPVTTGMTCQSGARTSMTTKGSETRSEPNTMRHLGTNGPAVFQIGLGCMGI